MNVDELARTAAADLWEDTRRGLDPDLMLRDLRRTRARRRAGWLAATAAVAAAVVLLVVALGSLGEPRRAVPAHPATRTGELLLVLGESGLHPVGGSLPHLPDLRVRPGQPTPALAASPDGTRLAYSGNGIEVMDLATGTTRRAGTCGPSCSLAWTPDGRELVVVTDGGRLERLDLASGTATPVPVPGDWSLHAWGVDVSTTGRVVVSGTAGADHAIMAVDLTGLHPSVVHRFGTSRLMVGDATWSHDGQSIAYVRKSRPDEPSVVASEQVVELVHPDGSGLRTVGRLGACVCLQAGPSLDWSPSGRLVAAAVGRGSDVRVVEVALDGRLTDVQASGNVVVWLPPAASGRGTPLGPMGEVLLFHQQGRGQAQPSLAVLGGSLPHLPTLPLHDSGDRTTSFSDLAFSPDGSQLASSDASRLLVTDLTTGAARELAACHACAVSWTPSGDSLELVATDDDRRGLTTYDLATGRRTRLALPSGWEAHDIDVGPGGVVLLGGRVDDVFAVMRIETDGRRPRVLATFPDGPVADPRWAPHFRSVAFLHWKGDLAAVHGGPVQVRTMDPDGRNQGLLAELGSCVCDHWWPSMDWSPLGRMAVLAPDSASVATVHDVIPDGRVTTMVAEPLLGPVAWRPPTGG